MAGEFNISNLFGWLKKFKQTKNNQREKDASVDFREVLKNENVVRTDGEKKLSSINESAGSPEDENKTKRVKDHLPPKQSKPEKEEMGKLNVLRTSLIQGEIVSYFDWRKSISILLAFIICAFFIVGGAYGYLFVLEKIKKEEIRSLDLGLKDIRLKTSLLQGGINDIVQFQKKLEIAKVLLDEHVYWTNFFQFLEKNTLSNVYYSDFNGNTSGLYNLAANTKDFYTIAQQVKAMQESNYVKEVIVAGGGVSTQKEAGGVGFNMNLRIDPGLFKK